MFLVRKVGSVLRGKATPFQVMLATVLGAVLGFVPGMFLPGDLGGGLLQAPGLILLLLCLVLIVNANLGVFGLTLLIAKLLSFALLPVSYAVGRFLLDGPLSGLFRALVNGKVTAWFGLEYYATAGGLVVGLGFGVLTGWLLNRGIRRLRTHMASLEENSERYQKYASKRSVRFLGWLFLGKGKGKASWQDLTQKKVGMPIRITGVVLAAVLIASVWVFQSFFSTPVLTRTVQGALQDVNGATVDLRAARLGLGDGQLLLEGLAIADKKELGKNVFSADTLAATIDVGELLRKRFVIDEVRSTNAWTGSDRQQPGIVVPGTEPDPEPPAPPAGQKTAEDWLKDFETWKQRLEQAADWLETIAGGNEPATEPTPEERDAQRREQEKAGLARVVATHLLEVAPRVVIRRIDIEGIGYSYGGRKDTIDLRARNLTESPSLLPVAGGGLSFNVKAKSDAFAVGLDRAVGQKADLGFDFAMKNLPVDSLFGQLKIGGAAPLQGGTMDLAAKGSLKKVIGQPLALELPVQVAMKDTTFALAGSTPTKVDSLLLPVGLSGSLTRPTVTLDDKALQDALVAAGQKELANFVQGQAGKLLGGTPLQGVVDPSKSLEQNAADALEKAKQEAQKKAEEEAKKKGLDAIKKNLPGGLQGILPGGK